MRKFLLQYTAALALLVSGLLSSCTEDIEIKTDHSPPVLVVYGYLTNEWTHQTVRVSSSSPYFDKAANPTVSGAVVQITSPGGETIRFRESETTSGLYKSLEKVAGVPGTTYVLSVETDFDRDGTIESYTATSTMPYPVEVDSIRIGHIVNSAFHAYELYLYAQDPPTTDYYLANYRVNDSLATAKLSMHTVLKDDFINGQYLQGLSISLFKDLTYEIEEGEDWEDDRVYLKEGDTLTLEFSRIEKGYYHFISQCQREMNGENPFFGAPASNIETNISNGGTGFFTSYCIDRTTTVVQTR